MHNNYLKLRLHYTYIYIHKYVNIYIYNRQTSEGRHIKYNIIAIRSIYKLVRNLHLYIYIYIYIYIYNPGT